MATITRIKNVDRNSRKQISWTVDADSNEERERAGKDSGKLGTHPFNKWADAREFANILEGRITPRVRPLGKSERLAMQQGRQQSQPRRERRRT